MGCVSGRSLFDLRKLGYNNSIGIDISSKSIELCENRGFFKGKDIFLMDGTNTTFKDNEFNVVSSQGLLAHFVDFTPFAKEMARISNGYVLLFRPNHFSLYRKIIDAVSGTPVDEYTLYGEREYVNEFDKLGLRLVKMIGYNLNEQFALLFKKK
jgi:ubiquinone/menaquinone biosynthesis C-methylase UbiE